MSQINIHEKYLPLWQDNVRYYLVTGGRGSSKSFSVAVRLLDLTYNPGEKILFTRYTLTSAYASIIPEFIEKIDLMGLQNDFKITKDEIINLTTNSSILFKGIRTTSGNQTAALKSLTGITAFVLDEAEELVDETIFDKIDFSVRKAGKHNRVIMIMNPATKAHWIYTRFFENKFVEAGFNGIKGDTCYIHTTYKDNKEYLPENYLQTIFEMKLRRPEKYDHVVLGGWLEKAEGVIFENWKTGKFKLLDKNCYGQDYGFSEDPSTLVHVSVDLTAHRVYLKELWRAKGLNTRQTASRNNRFAGVGLIIADDSNPRLIQELKSLGNNIKSVKNKNVKGALLARITLMQDFEVIVDPKSTELIKEFNNYAWKEPGRPIDKYDHGIQAAQYALTELYKPQGSGEYHVW